MTWYRECYRDSYKFIDRALFNGDGKNSQSVGSRGDSQVIAGAIRPEYGSGGLSATYSYRVTIRINMCKFAEDANEARRIESGRSIGCSAPAVVILEFRRWRADVPAKVDCHRGDGSARV